MESTAGKNWTEEDEKLLLETIDKWVKNEVKPIAREYDQEDKYPHELVESMKDLGLFGATISLEYGGMGLPAAVYAKVIIKVASVCMAPSGIFNSHNHVVIIIVVSNPVNSIPAICEIGDFLATLQQK